jgi:hypothetical protein
MNFADAIYVAFLVVCCWLAIHLDDPGGGGGKRLRLPTHS